jgi:hypothetical protein
MLILPKQARDKHGESTQKSAAFLQRLWDEALEGGGADNASFWSHFILKRSICQDRLGTSSKGKEETEGVFCR